MKIILISVGLLLAGIAIGFLAGQNFSTSPNAESHDGYSLRRQGGYQYINPLLECEIAQDKEFQEYVSLKKIVEDYIGKAREEKKATEVSVYFRDLNNGPWFGINERDEFSPASLFKIPTMITYFKLAETSPEVLTETLVYDGVEDLNAAENIKSEIQLEPGEEYTVDELIARMIVYSDNNARQMLGENIDDETQNEIYKDLGLDIPGIVSIEDYTSVRNYASFFRILYNATYLSRDMSEKALELLSRVEFDRGLRAGIPEEVRIAHKFGERVYPNGGANQLHECGIIYHERNPYILCVMTRGYEIEDLVGVIKGISSSVYSFVDSSSRQ